MNGSEVYKQIALKSTKFKKKLQLFFSGTDQPIPDFITGNNCFDLLTGLPVSNYHL